MTPFEMVTNINKPIPNPIPNDNKKVPKFQVGVFVRVPDKRNLYSKGYTTIGLENFINYMKLTKRIQ